MYFPIGWPQTLSCDGNVRSIIANSDQSLFLFVSDDALSIWFCRPPVKIVNYQRTNESIVKYGHNISACWRSDSSQIVMQTSLDYLLFYQVIINDQDVMPIIEPKNIMSNSSILQENRIPRLFLQLRNSLKIDEGITCIMSAEEEMVISTKTGLLCGIDWDGHPDQDFRFNISVPPNHYLKKESGHIYHIIHFKYSTIIGGFSLVFSNGLGAFLPLNESTSTHTQLQLISHVDNALCTAINHKYAFILYGLISSDAVACDFDEVDRRFVISNRLSLPSNVYPDAEKILGPMTSLQWTPDSSVLATIWENGDFALWSVFGSLLSYSLSWHSSLDLRSEFNGSSFKVASLAFGKEGFHLWMVVHGLPADSKNDNEAGKPVAANNNHVCKLSLVKSVLAANPCSSVSLESVLMSSEDRIFVGGNKNSSLIAQNRVDENERKAQTELLKNEKLSNVILSEQESNAVDSFQWITVTIPQNYLDINWPIRLFAIDSYTSQNIAVAGLNGFAMYSLVHRRWKMFGNENHEKDVTVTGGFLWYYEYLIAGCYNLSDENFEIRAYSHRNKLDNSNAKIITIENEVQLLSLYQNRLLAFCSNGNIFLYDLHLFKRNHHYSSPMDYDYDLNISAPIRVVLNNFELFPDCVTSCLLTDLHVEMYYGSYFHQSASTSTSASSTEIQSHHHHHHHRSSIIQNSCASRSHSILFNYCGRVLLLEMDIDTSKLPFSSDEDDDDDEDIDSDTLRDDINKKDVSKTIPNNNVNGDHSGGGGSGGPTLIKFKKVVKLASNVENLWVLPHDPVQLNAFRSPIIPSASVAALHRTTAYQQRPHLETSLYLSCGGHGMAIWLSLEHSIRPQYGNQAGKNSGVNIRPPTTTTTMTTTDENNTNEHTFISKRIMLPLSEIGSAIYPLAIRFRDAIVLGAESDFTQPNVSYSSTATKQNSRQNVFTMMPYFLVKRTSQVYLHYILRELLRRNLGYRSWEIANTCSTLPHFVHSLELLLHGVLEEEASSSQPIPDALLPRVVDFIRAFPVFLQTVIHCARKTELALWPHLFSIVGSPKDLFQQCLQEGQLDTASSYIIVLQNLEKPEVASRCASRLLQAARVAGCWTTVKELKRFLRATNQAEENESMTIINNCDPAKSSRSNSLCDKQQVPLAQQDVDVRSDQTSSVIPASHSPDIVPSMNGILESNHHVNKKPKARFGPGAAMKSSDDQIINQKSDIHDHSLAEENVVMNEADPQYQNNILKDSEESLNNFDDATSRNYQDSRPSKSSSYLYCNGNAKNARAYPGTILCMTTSQDAHNNEDKTQILNQALKFLALNEDSSVSSIVSTTSSSSTFSSSSIAPASTVQNTIQRGQVRGFTPNNNNNNFQTIKSGDGNSNAIEKLPPLRTISVASHDREQCRIS